MSPTECQHPSRLQIDFPLASVTRLTMAHERRRNALDLTLLSEMADEIARSTARCIIIRGAGNFFSAGYDLRSLDTCEEFEQCAEALIAHPATPLLDAIERSSATLIAQLNGPAMGGGFELAICCDLRLAADDASFKMPAGHLGLVYSHTGLRRFVETCGLPITKELFLMGATMSAARAERLGIVTAICPSNELDEYVLRVAREVTRQSPLSQAGNKRILQRLIEQDRSIDPLVEEELLTLRRGCFVAPDIREGISAFAERREPVWRPDAR